MASIYATAVSQICDYGHSLGRYTYRCGNDVLNEALSNGFSSELLKMKTYAQEIVVLVSGEQNQKTASDARLLEDLADVRGCLNHIARRVDERIKRLNSALADVLLCKETFPKLSEPDKSKHKDQSEWIQQILERTTLMQPCRRFFSQLSETINDHSSVAKWMQEELEKVDLERCKKISEEYVCSSEEIKGLVRQIGRIYDKVELRKISTTLKS